MCIVFGAFAHVCSAVVGPSELFHQNSLEVASVAELETVEAVQECRQWWRPECQKVLEIHTFCELEALKDLFCNVLEDSGAKKYWNPRCFWKSRPPNYYFCNARATATSATASGCYPEPPRKFKSNEFSF